MRGCIVGIALLACLVAAAYAGWRWGGAVFPRAERFLGVEAEPSEEEDTAAPSAELAEEVLVRYERFLAGSGDTLALSGREVTSVLRHALPGVLPPGVEDPAVVLEDSQLRLSVRVALDVLPRLPELRGVTALLPDTVPLDVRGSLIPFSPAGSALLVQRIDASGIPIPQRLVPEILRGLGRVDRPGLPREGLAVPLPDGLESAYIEGDRLILVARRR